MFLEARSIRIWYAKNYEYLCKFLQFKIKQVTVF